MECYDKNKPKCNRGSKYKTVYHTTTEKHERCCHRLLDLEGTRDPWWCSKVFHHSEAWEGRISGCISCEREFLKVGGRGWGWFFSVLHISLFVKLAGKEERASNLHWVEYFWAFCCLWVSLYCEAWNGCLQAHCFVELNGFLLSGFCFVPDLLEESFWGYKNVHWIKPDSFVPIFLENFNQIRKSLLMKQSNN